MLMRLPFCDGGSGRGMGREDGWIYMGKDDAIGGVHVERLSLCIVEAARRRVANYA